MTIKAFRLPFVLLAMLCLLLGLWSGLNRIGWNFGLLPLNMHHGAIMVGGFLGTLISIEKIIPLKNKLLFTIPIVSATSLAFFILNQPVISFYCLVVSSLGLSTVFLYYMLNEKNLIYMLMLAGSICWLTGNVMLISHRFYPMALPWWVGFMLFIIVSERLELMKFLPVSRQQKSLLIFFLITYVIGIVFSFHGPGNIVSGLALICTSVWLLKFDIVGIAIRKNGLPKFVAISLTGGYIAMMLTGIFYISLSGQAFGYDAVAHTFFLGFVFSMIFAHGPIILPGVLGIFFNPYHPLLYVWLFLLHSSWMVRITGDLLLSSEIRKSSGMMSATAILSYFLTVATLIFLNQKRHAKIL